MADTTDMDTTSWVDKQMGALEPSYDLRPDAGRALAGIRERERARVARRRTWLWGASTAGTLGVLLLSFPPTRGIVERCYTAACAIVLPDTAQSALDLAGMEESPAAPDFVLQDIAGRDVRLSDFRGEVVLVNFWATWCPPCKMEMPWFVAFQRKYEDRGFSVVAISLDEQGWDAVRPFVEILEPNFPVVMGNNEVAERFGGIGALPATFLIDREGIIRDKYAGLVSPDEYETAIQRLLD